MTIGQRIRERRKALGLTQKQLAELCGMADSAIRKYESGRITPKYQTLKKIADALQLPSFALSGIDFEVDTDGAGAALIDLCRIKKGTAKKLTSQKSDPSLCIGIPLKNDSERSALEYLVEFGEPSPEWIARLINAFSKLSFQRQQTLISTAEYWVQEDEFMSEMEGLGIYDSFESKE